MLSEYEKEEITEDFVHFMSVFNQEENETFSKSISEFIKLKGYSDCYIQEIKSFLLKNKGK